MKSDLLSLVLPDNRVRKITRPCPFCTRKYERTSGFFGLWYRVQRFPEKALVLLDECLPKGTHPALISTHPSSDQFKLKEYQNREFLLSILVDYNS